MINLSDVTLIALTSIKIPETIRALEYSYRGINFGAVKLVTDKEFCHAKIKKEYCPPMVNIDEYNRYAFLELGSHVDTSHALVIQHDSSIIYPESWDNNWLNFDYLGAPWCIPQDSFSYRANNGELVRVGNGGFSLRSKLLMGIPKICGWELREDHGFKNEDGNIVCYWRKEFLERKIKYAPVEVAARFSYENEVPENQNIDKFFGFHKNLRWSMAKELGFV